MVVFDNSIFCLCLHPLARARFGVDRVRDRVEYLLYRLRESKERVILPAPAFAEFLVFAGKDGPDYLARIRETSIFRVAPFDERAAIQLADIEIAAVGSGNKRGPAGPATEWQKVKFDRQIVAIAKVHGASEIYSDDPDIKKHGEACGIRVVQLADLPLPPASQVEMFNEAEEADTPGTAEADQ